MCYQYWSKTGVAQFGEYTVDLLEEKAVKGFLLRKITVYNIKVDVNHLNTFNTTAIICGATDC